MPELGCCDTEGGGKGRERERENKKEKTTKFEET
jgi:hypothetical protein